MTINVRAENFQHENLGRSYKITEDTIRYSDTPNFRDVGWALRRVERFGALGGWNCSGHPYEFAEAMRTFGVTIGAACRRLDRDNYKGSSDWITNWLLYDMDAYLERFAEEDIGENAEIPDCIDRCRKEIRTLRKYLTNEPPSA